MKIDKSLHEDYAVLTLKGEFDTFYCPILMEEVDSLVERGVHNIILNMRLVKFINSTALGAIIRAHKRCKAEGGELVVDRPSSFVRDIVGKLGIDQVVPMFDSEDEATKHIIKALNASELVGDTPVDQAKILIAFPDETRNKQIGGRKTLVGTMANVDANRLQFVWSGERSGISADQAKQLFFEGSDLKLKFQVKLIKKGYFEILAKVREALSTGDGSIRVTVGYDKIPEGDQAALGQFAADMEFLKRQLPSS
jgi:anti-anti-sigma factor